MRMQHVHMFRIHFFATFGMRFFAKVLEEASGQSLKYCRSPDINLLLESLVNVCIFLLKMQHVHTSSP